MPAYINASSTTYPSTAARQPAVFNANGTTFTPSNGQCCILINDYRGIIRVNTVLAWNSGNAGLTFP